MEDSFLFNFHYIDDDVTTNVNGNIRPNESF